MAAKPIIRHLVVSGGGVTGFSYYGILRESAKHGVWQLANIQSMHGTSIGALICVITSLGYDWAILDDYLIKRPWHTVFKIDMSLFMESIQKWGLFNDKEVRELCLPLFKGKDIPIEITMKELYERTNIDLHIYTTELNSFTMVDICHTKYPDWPVVDALFCSMSLPIAFAPNIRNGECYCDGGVFANYPLTQCIRTGVDKDEILGVARKSNTNKAMGDQSNSTFLEYILFVVRKILERFLDNDSTVEIANEFIVVSPPVSIYDIYKAANSMEERLRLIDAGVRCFRETMGIPLDDTDSTPALAESADSLD
jgi:predicted acylesterase/phospholipase RssA